MIDKEERHGFRFKLQVLRGLDEVDVELGISFADGLDKMGYATDEDELLEIPGGEGTENRAGYFAVGLRGRAKRIGGTGEGDKGYLQWCPPCSAASTRSMMAFISIHSRRRLSGINC